jgi:hypothetical protein
MADMLSDVYKGFKQKKTCQALAASNCPDEIERKKCLTNG